MHTVFFIIFLSAFSINIYSHEIAHSENDSLLYRAQKCLKESDFLCAKDYFVRAFRSGMSRDSLCFFIAGLYIKKGNLDTAIVYNLACTTSSSVLYSSVLKQRSDIVNLLQKKNTTINAILDSSRLAPPNLPGISISLSYMQFKTDEYSLFGVSDIDTFFDYKLPGCGLSLFYKLKSKKYWGSFLPGCDVSTGGFMPVDLLDDVEHLRKLFFSSEFQLSHKKGQMITNQFSVNHQVNRMTIFSNEISYEIPFRWRKNYCRSKFYGLLTIPGQFQFREIKSGMSLSKIRVSDKWFQKGIILDASYNWRYDRKYLSYVKGYTDELIQDSTHRYFFDPQCTDSSDDFVSDYWSKLPLNDWIVLSERSVDLSTMFSGNVKVGKFWNFNAAVSVKGRMFFGKTRWFNVENNVNNFLKIINSTDSIDVIALIYEKKSGQLYSLNGPLSQSYTDGVQKVYYHQKKRMDGILGFQTSLCYNRKKTGEICISAYLNRTLSTLSKYDTGIPLPGLCWGIYSSWKPAFWLHPSKKVKRAN
ncbi:MAG TPA: hypothetical protein VHP36_03150 [Chitinispirillaceae bacterium]|nr:hypothetical protein [Chitinispirillaceae bacterium]